MPCADAPSCSSPARALRAACVAALVTLIAATAPAAAQSLVTEPSVLHVRASRAPDGPWRVTPPRLVRLDRTDREVTPWKAEPTTPWLSVTPAEGAGPAGLTMHVDAARLGADAATGEILISAHGDIVARVTVHASVVAVDAPPFGAFDVPVDGTVPSGPVRLFGWVLDDVGVSSVEICRTGAARDGDVRCGDGQGVHATWAELHVAERPDVTAVFPGFEHAGPANWTAMLTMPNDPRDPGAAAPYYAVALDTAGQFATIGTRGYLVSDGPFQWRRHEPQAALTGLFLVFMAVHLLGRRLLPTRHVGVPPVAGPLTPRPSLVEYAVLAAILAGFAAITIPELGRSLDYDELYSASQFIVEHSWWTSATMVQTYNNHFGNSLLASAFVRLLGPDEWALRLPAFLLALGAIVVTWRLGRRLAGPATGLCAAALLALSPVFLLWGRSARGYAGLACLAWLSADAFARVMRTGSAGQARVHAATTILLPVFHLFGVWMLAIQYVMFLGWSLAARFGRQASLPAEGLWRLHRSFLIVGAGTLLIFLPSIGGLITNRPRFSRRAAADAAASAAPASADALWQSMSETLGRWAGLASDLLTTPEGVALLLPLGLLVIGAFLLPRLEASLGVAAIVVPPVVLTMAGQSVTGFPRFFSFLLPMIAIFMAAAIVVPFRWQRPASPARRWAGVAVGLVTVAAGLTLAWAWMGLAPRSGSQGFRERLERPAGWSDTPAVTAGSDSMMFDHYLGRPAPIVTDPVAMDLLLRKGERLLVAFHNPAWNGQNERRMQELLLRRCVDVPRGQVILFECR